MIELTFSQMLGVAMIGVPYMLFLYLSMDLEDAGMWTAMLAIVTTYFGCAALLAFGVLTAFGGAA
jgi:hypothetical protein